MVKSGAAFHGVQASRQEHTPVGAREHARRHGPLGARPARAGVPHPRHRWHSRPFEGQGRPRNPPPVPRRTGTTLKPLSVVVWKFNVDYVDMFVVIIILSGHAIERTYVTRRRPDGPHVARNPMSLSDRIAFMSCLLCALLCGHVVAQRRLRLLYPVLFSAMDRGSARYSCLGFTSDAPLHCGAIHHCCLHQESMGLSHKLDHFI